MKSKRKKKLIFQFLFYINRNIIKKQENPAYKSIGWGTWIRTKEMSDSESDALPLGYTPITGIIL